MEQFAFATVVSFLWIQTFASLEGYETVQVLLVSIRDMLQALGGFSLILTVRLTALSSFVDVFCFPICFGSEGI